MLYKCFIGDESRIVWTWKWKFDIWMHIEWSIGGQSVQSISIGFGSRWIKEINGEFFNFMIDKYKGEFLVARKVVGTRIDDISLWRRRIGSWNW